MKKIWVVQYVDGTADVYDEEKPSPAWPYVDAFDAEVEIKRLRNALHLISLGSKNSGTTKEDLGKGAREALNEQRLRRR
jgi:hypothetical protein